MLAAQGGRIMSRVNKLGELFHKDAKQGSPSSSRLWLIMVESCALAFVWPVPHSIALRNTLIAALLLTLSLDADWQRILRFVRGPGRSQAILYTAFTLWILVVAVFISPFTSWSLSEINGQWFAGFVALLVGVATAFQRDVRIGPATVVALLGVLAVQVLAVDLQGVWVLARTGAWSQMARLGGLTPAREGKLPHEFSAKRPCSGAKPTNGGRRDFLGPRHGWGACFLLVSPASISRPCATSFSISSSSPALSE